MKIALIDTIPADARNTGIINLGYEIASDKLSADRLHWKDLVTKKYDKYAFNVFYPTHVFNMFAFLRRNNIPLLKEGRTEYVIAGGQGVSNITCLDDIVNEVYKGEIDGDALVNGWNRLTDINTEHVTKGDNTLIELTRGCKYRCKFCEYGWVQGGKFRQKDISVVKNDIDKAIFYGHDRRINFLSANLGSYYALDELLDYCNGLGVYIMNTDVCLKDFDRSKESIINRQAIKVGLESFDEATRKSIGKSYSDDKLMEFFWWSVSHIGYIHLYLIYGLPNDNYDKWYEWLKILGDMRKAKPDRLIRMEFSITNFEPCRGTPFETAPLVDFEHKNMFLGNWTKALKDNNFRNGEGEITYKNGRGRLGRKQASYEMLMRIKYADSSITDALVSSFKKGISRTISDKDALDFLSK